MKDGDINTYIATFKKLLKAAGYTENEQGALKMFKMGLLLNALCSFHACALSALFLADHIVL